MLFVVFDDETHADEERKKKIPRTIFDNDDDRKNLYKKMMMIKIENFVLYKMREKENRYVLVEFLDSREPGNQ